MAISVAGPDITGIGSAIGAIADEASEVMNEFDRPNWRFVHISRTKNGQSRHEFAFSKFDFVFYAIAGACVYKGIKEHIAGGSFYEWVKEEMVKFMTALRSEIQKAVGSAGAAGMSAFFGGEGQGVVSTGPLDIITLLTMGPITGPLINYLRQLMGGISTGMSDDDVIKWWKDRLGIETTPDGKTEEPNPNVDNKTQDLTQVNIRNSKSFKPIGKDYTKIAPFYRDKYNAIMLSKDDDIKKESWYGLYSSVYNLETIGKTYNRKKNGKYYTYYLTQQEIVDMRNFRLYIEQNWNTWTK